MFHVYSLVSHLHFLILFIKHDNSTPMPERHSCLTHRNLLFLFLDTCLGHTDKFHQPSSESRAV
ncbi:hypothetical protein U0070_020499 [Myodes glareolus]|uniref:Secreted protein n=1 Tax=Myodes glareolus TaxID=447135 RepID=A0AAW0JB54_MYOGA